MLQFSRAFSKILSLTALLTLVGCGLRGNTFRLNGTIKGMEAGDIYIYNLSVDDARFDTLRLEAGNFYYGGNVEEITPYLIVFPNALEQVVFIGPGEEITYEAVSNDLNKYRVNGMKENDLMSEFREETQNASYSSIQAAARKYLTDNQESVVALYLFDRYFVQNSQTTYKELEDILAILRPSHEDDTYFMSLEGKVKRMKALNQGDEFPNIKMRGRGSITGNVWPSNSDYTLFVCWATWIPSSYELLAKVRLLERGTPKSKLRIIAYSIDNEYGRWENMVKYDSINGIEHYNDARAFAAPVIEQTGIGRIPTYYLLKSDHKILAKGSELNQLNTDIDKYIKE